MYSNPLAIGAVIGGAVGGISGSFAKFITNDKAAGQLAGGVVGALTGGIAGGCFGATTVMALSTGLRAIGGGSAGTIAGSISGYNTASLSYKNDYWEYWFCNNKSLNLNIKYLLKYKREKILFFNYV